MRLGYETVRYLLLFALAAAMLLAVYAVASAPSRVANRLGMRGLKRQRALQENSSWAQVEPLVRWLGVRVSGLIGEGMRARIDRQISLAGDFLGLTAEEYVGLSILSFLGGLIVGAVAGWLTGVGSILIPIVGPVGAAMPYFLISGEAQERLKQIGRGLPYVIDLMALAMSAGQDFPGAVRQVVEKSSNPDDALVEEFTRILQELQLGRTRKQALIGFAARAPVESVQEFVSAVVQAEERGNPVADVLQIQASVSRLRRSVKAEEMAAKAGVAMVAPLFLLFFCIMLLVIAPMILQLAAQSE
ncbi:MAG TPA: type II secretion system F family protein [Polyangiaceae bacterium]|nr:type II secretion system F family protein [Polyangiaceae bacterium]